MNLILQQDAMFTDKVGFRDYPTVSYVASLQLMQNCAGLILGISSNELQVCTSTKIDVLDVPITLP